MARTGRAEKTARACPFHHCASVPPISILESVVGMFIQAAVPRPRGSAAGGPGARVSDGRSGRIFLCVLRRGVVLLLVG